ncbi:energy transducer TonB [Flavobacterium sp. N3904]|uniref:energy transducer TonB n=1 Tax=Flavobacterium sp. N3904 TaxID=2986835 RepID=UPI00222490C7|nr:energy transducer TonB [Flavobacterium sp. N3904]
MHQKKLHLLIAIFIIQYSVAQDTITTFYDQNWKEIKNIENASFSRKFFISDKIYVANDYYKNGSIQMTGTYTNKKGTFREGFFKYFFENGNVKSEGNYLKNKQNGKWKNYLENGTLESEGEYVQGKKNGNWIWYSETGKICANENYIKNKRINYKFFDDEGKEIDISSAEHLASFQGGDANNFTRWVLKNVRYPLEANDSHGTVVIEFYVNTLGEVEDIKIAKSVNRFLDAEAIRVIYSSPTWNPAKEHNKYVKLFYSIPITFK